MFPVTLTHFRMHYTLPDTALDCTGWTPFCSDLVRARWQQAVRRHQARCARHRASMRERESHPQADVHQMIKINRATDLTQQHTPVM